MTIMFLSGAVGFLLASLIALFLAPSLWRRAARVTTKNLMQKSPRISKDGHADRDHMRAEFAVTTRMMEVKIGRLKEEADSRLIELTKVKKKRDRLQGKITSLQKAVDQRERKVEKLRTEVVRMQSNMDEKKEQLDSHVERLAQQSELLNTQATTLHDTTGDLTTSKQKNSDYAHKQAEYSALIAKQQTEISELQTKQQEIKSAVAAKDANVIRQTEKLNQEVCALTEKMEAGRLSADQSQQEINKNLVTISDLRREIHHKEYKIKGLKERLEIITSRQARAPSASRHLAKPLPASTEISSNGELQINAQVAPVNGTENPQSRTRFPLAHIRSSRKKQKPIKAPDTRSLAEKIRSLQDDQSKPL